jgi:hypothetical protein
MCGRMSVSSWMSLSLRLFRLASLSLPLCFTALSAHTHSVSISAHTDSLSLSAHTHSLSLSVPLSLSAHTHSLSLSVSLSLSAHTHTLSLSVSMSLSAHTHTLSHSLTRCPSQRTLTLSHSLSLCPSRRTLTLSLNVSLSRRTLTLRLKKGAIGEILGQNPDLWAPVTEILDAFGKLHDFVGCVSAPARGQSARTTGGSGRSLGPRQLRVVLFVWVWMCVASSCVFGRRAHSPVRARALAHVHVRPFVRAHVTVIHHFAFLCLLLIFQSSLQNGL